MANYEVTSIPFQIRYDVLIKLGDLARFHGFKTAGEYLRWLAEREVGFGETTNLRDVRSMLLTPLEKLILEKIIERPWTKTQLTTELHKHPSSVQLCISGMLNKLWVHSVGEKYTGGRTATLYTATELGRQKLEQEQKRRQDLAALNVKARQADMAASAAADPEAPPRKPKRKRLCATGPETEQGAFLQAVLDAIYAYEEKSGKTYTDDQVIAFAESAKTDAMGLIIGAELGTWAEETARFKRDGWVEPEPPPEHT